jgi:hypothetical protein
MAASHGRKEVSINALRGIGPKFTLSLAKIGILTVDDFLQAGETEEGLCFISVKTQIPFALLLKWIEQAKESADTTGDQAKETTGPGSQIEGLIHKLYPSLFTVFLNRPGLAAIAYFFLGTGIQLVLAILFGGFRNTPDIIDITEDPFQFPTLLVISIAIYFYFMLPRLLISAFEGLADNHIFLSRQIQINPSIRSLFDARWVRYLPIGLTLLLGITVSIWDFFIIKKNLRPWTLVHPINFVIGGGVLFIGWFFISALIVNVFLATRLINKIFQDNEIIVFPLHPDKSGGFGPLGKYSLRMTYLALGFGGLLVAFAINSTFNTGIIKEDYLLFSWVATYLVVVPTLFFLPLLSAHHAMESFRDILINQTSAQYLRTCLRAHLETHQESKKLKENLEYMEILQELERRERGFPSWPFNLGIILNVSANTVLPALPTFIGFAIELLR